MKYIDFESWIITWLHEGNVIVEDQLTHSGSRTAPPKAVFCRSAKCEQKLTMILFYDAPDTDKQVYGNLIG